MCRGNVTNGASDRIRHANHYIKIQGIFRDQGLHTFSGIFFGGGHLRD